jgi:phage terminase large subunit
MGVADIALWNAQQSLHKLYPELYDAPVAQSIGRADKPSLALPDKLRCLFTPSRYKVLYGGRGGAKSWGVAKTLLVKGAEKKLRILCARELQVSIEDSVHKLLSDLIASDPWLSDVYDVQKKSIVCKTTGTEFIFAGIRNNVTKIKSMEGIDIVWVEEAEKVSDYSWQVLIPTIRKPNSEIWVTFNPDEETDPTSRRFIKNLPPNAIAVEISWRDNPWFPEELRQEMEYLYKIDPEAAEHVWGGKFRKNSAAQIMRGKYKVESFIVEPTWDGPYFGADFGFTDPSTLVKVWIDTKTNRLYIEHEFYGCNVDSDKLPAEYDKIPGAKKRQIRADSSRPETISYLQRHGYPNVVGCTKGEGSVEDGVAFIRSFECVVIHTRCVHTAEEARLYSYKIDRLTKLPTNDIEDKHNHIWDAVRYALEPVSKQRQMGMLNYMKDLAAARKEA